MASSDNSPWGQTYPPAPLSPLSTSSAEPMLPPPSEISSLLDTPSLPTDPTLATKPTHPVSLPFANHFKNVTVGKPSPPSHFLFHSSPFASTLPDIIPAQSVLTKPTPGPSRPFLTLSNHAKPVLHSSAPESPQTVIKLPSVSTIASQPIVPNVTSAFAQLRTLFPPSATSSSANPFQPQGCLVQTSPKAVVPDFSNLLEASPAEDHPLLNLENIADKSIRAEACGACGLPNPSVECRKCRFVRYCCFETCLKRDRIHEKICTRYAYLDQNVRRQQDNHQDRLELIAILEHLYFRLRTRRVLQEMIWHYNEIMRLLGPATPEKIIIDLSFALLRDGKNDEVVSLIRFCTRRRANMINDLIADYRDYVLSEPGRWAFPIDMNRYQDALEGEFPASTISVVNLVALCVVKVRIIVAIRQYRGTYDFRLGKVHPSRAEILQVALLEKYLSMIGEDHPIIENGIRDIKTLYTGHTPGHKHAQLILGQVGDLLQQLPGFPDIVF